MTKDQVRVLRTSLISLTALWHIYYCPYFRNEKLEMWNTLPKITQLLLSHFSHVWLCVTPETAAHQAPSSLGSSRQEHWSGLPFHPPIRESEVAQSCPTLSDPVDCSPPGSSVHGIFQARVLEWVAIAFSKNNTASKCQSQEESLLRVKSRRETDVHLPDSKLSHLVYFLLLWF